MNLKLITAMLVTSGFVYSLEAPLPIPSLARQSDAIVVGRPINAVLSGSVASVTFLVDRVVAGTTIISGTQINITGNAPNGLSSAMPERALCFLRNGGAGWNVLPRISNSAEFNKWCFAALPDTEMARLTSRIQVPDRLLAEILFALAVSGPTSPHDYDQILAAIPQASFQEYITMLSIPANNPMLLALRIRHSDPSALAELEGIVALNPNLLTQLANQICTGYMSPSPAGIAALGRLALSKGPKRLRNCAAYALRLLHVPETLPVLAQLMHDSDIDIRFEGVFGLASAANAGRIPGERPLSERGQSFERKQLQLATDETQKQIPSPVAFRSNESAYVSFWTNWWLANHDKLGQPLVPPMQ